MVLVEFVAEKIRIGDFNCLKNLDLRAEYKEALQEYEAGKISFFVVQDYKDAMALIKESMSLYKAYIKGKISDDEYTNYVRSLGRQVCNNVGQHMPVLLKEYRRW